jgi:hypothetical protein
MREVEMTVESARVTSLTIAILACHSAIGPGQPKVAAWLDEAKRASWNKAGLSIPAAPRIEGAVIPRCREQARPAELEEDKRVREQG